jgi:ribosomal-protein-alanine N-acetyltransferase
MPGLHIRRMLRQDAPQVCEVDRQCSTLPWSEYAFVAELTNTAGYYLVAEEDGNLVGFIGSQMILDEAHITTFGVLPSRRRRHIGERLFAALLEEALRHGCRRITLEVRESNHAARSLYAKYGFSPVARRRGYYTDNSEDAVVMWVEDTTAPSFRELLQLRLAALGP